MDVDGMAMEKQEINSHGIDLVVRNIPVSVAWWLNARNPYPTSPVPEVVTYFMEYAKNGISGQRNSSRNKESDLKWYKMVWNHFLMKQ